MSALPETLTAEARAELVDRIAKEMLAIATKGGIRVTEEQLREAIKHMSEESLRRQPREYQRNLDFFQGEMGLDLNDPDCFRAKNEITMTSAEFWAWMASGEDFPEGYDGIVVVPDARPATSKEQPVSDPVRAPHKKGGGS